MIIDNILVSVIVPIYNVRDYLYKCIESIQNQTHDNIEIILVDDGSSDGSEIICDEFSRRDKRIRVVHKENGGTTSARKVGFNLSKGSYIGFVDGDDWIEENMYEEMLESAVKNGAQVVLSDMYRHKFTGEITIWKSEMPAGPYCMNGPDGESVVKHLFPGIKSSNRRGISGGIHVKLFERKLLKRYMQNIDDRIRGFIDDQVIVYPVILNAQRIQIMDKVFYHGIDRKGSATHSVHYDFFEQMQMIYDCFKKSFELHPMRECLMEQLSYFVMNQVISQVNSLTGKIRVPEYYLSSVDRIRGKDVVLYGAGKVGKSYYTQIMADRISNIVLWIDKMPEGNVSPMIEIQNIEYDYVVISVIEKMMYKRDRKSVV